MELAPVKSELSPRSHRLLVIDGSEVIATKCVKRRRRGSSMSVLGGNEQQGEKLEEHKQLGTATTVKRSSRFRGVSRHDLHKHILGLVCLLFSKALFCILKFFCPLNLLSIIMFSKSTSLKYLKWKTFEENRREKDETTLFWMKN